MFYVSVSWALARILSIGHSQPGVFRASSSALTMLLCADPSHSQHVNVCKAFSRDASPECFKRWDKVCRARGLRARTSTIFGRFRGGERTFDCTTSIAPVPPPAPVFPAGKHTSPACELSLAERVQSSTCIPSSRTAEEPLPPPPPPLLLLPPSSSSSSAAAAHADDTRGTKTEACRAAKGSGARRPSLHSASQYRTSRSLTSRTLAAPPPAADALLGYGALPLIFAAVASVPPDSSSFFEYDQGLLGMKLEPRRLNGPRSLPPPPPPRL